jgi:CBS domain-containing protein
MDISSKVEREVALLDENQSALDAAGVMVERHIGSVVVTGAGIVKGIFTERDLLRVVAECREPARLRLRDAMSTDLVHARPGDSVEYCLDLMRAHRVRHLLVFEGADFVGIVSLRDLVALMLEEKESLVASLTSYITG